MGRTEYTETEDDRAFCEMDEHYPPEDDLEESLKIDEAVEVMQERRAIYRAKYPSGEE